MKRKLALINSMLDELDKESAWRFELILRRNWDKWEESSQRSVAIMKLVDQELEDILFPDKFAEMVQEAMF